MKILIISATIGQGHNAVAKSVAKELRSRGITCDVLDMYRYISPALQKIVQGGYLASIRSVQHTRVIGAKYYEGMEKNYKPLNEYPSARKNKVPFAKKIHKFIEEYEPDAIICTMVYCVHIVDTIKALGWKDVPLIGIDTDFTVQAHWQGNDYLDYMVVASEALAPYLKERQIPEQKVLPFGIPINPKFGFKVEKRLAKEMLCLDPDKKVILVMGGSMGYGNMDRTIYDLDDYSEDFQAMVVCGSNIQMHHRLRKHKFSHRFDVYGFSHDIPLMMDAADVVITKPGGISLSEALAKHVPMVLANAIPGMEDYNCDFMVRNGLALAETKIESACQATERLLYDNDLRARMERNMETFAHPDSTQKLCDFVVELTEKEIEKRYAIAN